MIDSVADCVINFDGLRRTWGVLIAARLAQGARAVLMMPRVMLTISTASPARQEHGRCRRTRRCWPSARSAGLVGTHPQAPHRGTGPRGARGVPRRAAARHRAPGRLARVDVRVHRGGCRTGQAGLATLAAGMVAYGGFLFAVGCTYRPGPGTARWADVRTRDRDVRPVRLPLARLPAWVHHLLPRNRFVVGGIGYLVAAAVFAGSHDTTVPDRGEPAAVRHRHGHRVVFLTLVARPAAHASAGAIATTLVSVAALIGVGEVLSIGLARTVRRT